MYFFIFFFFFILFVFSFFFFYCFFFFFFFFQAEDGIRDLTVTGVQTCALPISQTWVERHFESYLNNPNLHTYPICLRHGDFGTGNLLYDPQRSEEHTSELQSQSNLVCRLLLEKKKKKKKQTKQITKMSTITNTQ